MSNSKTAICSGREGSMRAIIIFATALMLSIVILQVIAFAEEVRIGAGQAPTQNILQPIKTHFEGKTGIKLMINPCGPKIALEELEKGAVEIAMGGLGYEDWLSFMKKEGAEVKDTASLQHVIVGKDKVVVIVHKNNPVAKLSKEQLKGIFTGRIDNWKEVGGNDIPMIVVWTKLLGGNFLFTKTVLDGEGPTKDVLEVNTSEDARHTVMSNQEAIALGPLAIVDASVKSPEIPEVARPITLITKGKPSANVQKLIDFINGEGQKYVKQ
jgi:phosphate transport system substrate-binding protein